MVWNDDTAAFSVRSLKGPESSLRYLLTACDGQMLRQEVLKGASKRKGRRISGLLEIREISGYSGITVQGLPDSI